MGYYETARLRALYSYNVLDTPPEPNFDRISKLAAEIFGLPICTLSFADAERHWFKSRHGVDAAEMPRKMSFCDVTLQGDTGFIVPDAMADPRFIEAPVVAGPPHVRFYAGTPLVTPTGQRIGSLCVLDTKPHHDFIPARMGILAGLAGTSIELLEARSRNIELARCTEELAHIAGHDSLTGLANRRMLQSRLDELVGCAQPDDEVALLYIDLDHFKQVNDTFGHGLGDALLQEVAQRMREQIRHTDQVARLGGDEFAILVSGRGVRQRAMDLARTLVAELSAPYLFQGTTVRISTSIGVTLVPDLFQNRPRLDELLKNADAGLYEAKSDGRSRFHLFET